MRVTRRRRKRGAVAMAAGAVLGVTGGSAIPFASAGLTWDDEGRTACVDGAERALVAVIPLDFAKGRPITIDAVALAKANGLRMEDAWVLTADATTAHTGAAGYSMRDAQERGLLASTSPARGAIVEPASTDLLVVQVRRDGTATARAGDVVITYAQGWRHFDEPAHVALQIGGRC